MLFFIVVLYGTSTSFRLQKKLVMLPKQITWTNSNLDGVVYKNSPNRKMKQKTKVLKIDLTQGSWTKFNLIIESWIRDSDIIKNLHIEIQHKTYISEVKIVSLQNCKGKMWISNCKMCHCKTLTGHPQKQLFADVLWNRCS